MAVIGEMDVFGINKDKQYEVVDRKSRQSIEKINKGVNNSDKDVTAGKVWKSTSEGAGWADSDSMSDNQSGGVDITINGVKRTLQKQNETSDSMADNENGGVDITIGGTKKTVAKQADLKEIEKSQNELKSDIENKEESGTAESKVSEHNTATDAHNDIRILVEGLRTRLNALADSDDETLDQMSEVVAYIKSNKSLIDAITTSKVSITDIIDNLTTNVSNKPLSAAQGVALKALIDAILPIVTTADNGKFLRVADGIWTAVALTDVSEVGA